MRTYYSILLLLGSALAGSAEVRVERIRVGDNAEPVLTRYAGIAQKEMARRYAVKLPVVGATSPAAGSLELGVAAGAPGWSVTPRDGSLRVEGGSAIDAVHALGVALRRLEPAGGKLVYRGAPITVAPALAFRGIYGPAHFKNPYEKLSTQAMGEIYVDWALWGANAAWNWVDTQMLVDPFSNKPGAKESMALTQKVLDLLGAAQAAGLEIGMTVGTNVVWLDQFREHPELRAELGDRQIIGQLLCPSKPGGRAIIHDNIRKLLGEAKRKGLRLTSLDFYTRDPSGCSDSLCKPWSTTSLKVIRDAVGAARDVYPGMRGDLITWYWNEQETREAVEWLASFGPGDWLRYWFHHFRTWAPKPVFPQLRMPSPVRLAGMYNLSAADNDVYGEEGAITRFRYLQMVMPHMAEHGMEGFHGYTEGNYDDLNKAVALQMMIDPRRSLREIVAEYCRWEFGADTAQANELARMIVELDDLHASAARLPAIVERMQAIGAALPAWGRGWRYTQLRLRGQIAVANIEILDGLPPHGAEAGPPSPPNYKAVIGKRLRELMRMGLEKKTLTDVQDAVWEGYQYLLAKEVQVRKRAVLAHELMHASGVDADQIIGLSNIYVGDWPTWRMQQHWGYYKVVKATTVADQHKAIQELWP